MTFNEQRCFILCLSNYLHLAKVAPHPKFLAIYWLDRQYRVNWCWVEPWKFNSKSEGPALSRIYINSPPPAEVRFNISILAEWTGWKGIADEFPAWRMQVTCGVEELIPVSIWVADIVNRREGFEARVLEPPVELRIPPDEEQTASGYYWTTAAYKLWQKERAGVQSLMVKTPVIRGICVA